MAATRTAKGTAEGKNPTFPVTAISSLTVANGASLICGVVMDDRNSLAATGYSLEWNSTAMNEDLADNPSGQVAKKAWIMGLHNVSGATGNLVIDHDRETYFALWATQVEGLVASPLDETATDDGDSTTPNSGVTATTGVADAFLVGNAFSNEDDNSLPLGTNTGDCSSDGQSVATSGGGSPNTEATAQETYATVSSTGTYDNSFTGFPNQPWICQIAAYEIDTTAPTRDHRGNNPMGALLPLLPLAGLLKLSRSLHKVVTRRRFLGGSKMISALLCAHATTGATTLNQGARTDNV